MASITNFTGAALDQQMAAVDLRSAQSTGLTSDLLGSRLNAGLLPSNAVFGAGGLDGSPLAPLDGLNMGPEIGDLGAGLDELLEELAPNVNGLNQNFGRL